MRILGYIGKHEKDTLWARLGWALVRLAQVGETYRRVTHCELLYGGHWWLATMAGASLRDGGVREIVADLTPGNWIVLDVPAWDDVIARQFVRLQLGRKYDARGALATVLWFLKQPADQWFCSELLAAAAGLMDSHRYKPSSLFALAASLPGTRDITAEFFNGQEV